jgi:hypothetical protein
MVRVKIEGHEVREDGTKINPRAEQNLLPKEV